MATVIVRHGRIQRVGPTAMNASQAWAADIRRVRHIADFHAWEVNASYQKAFERLFA
jgi:hypothetical protein